MIDKPYWLFAVQSHRTGRPHNRIAYNIVFYCICILAKVSAAGGREQCGGLPFARSNSSYLLILSVRADERNGSRGHAVRPRLFSPMMLGRIARRRQRVDVCAFLAEIGNRATHVLFLQSANAPLKIDATMLISTGCRRYADISSRGRRATVESRVCGAAVGSPGYVCPPVYSVASFSVVVDSHSRRFSFLCIFFCFVARKAVTRLAES